ncbi:MAG: hypothetical protein E6708_35155, partial [Bradyrhizobium sp.]|nr:hypothetical protein [Bradyrhizobium sp.]
MSDVAISSAKQAVTKGNLTEDWLALVIGVLVFALSLFSLGGIDLLGWAVTTSVYTDLGKALAPVAKGYAALGGLGSLAATYVSLLVVLTAGVAALGGDAAQQDRRRQIEPAGGGHRNGGAEDHDRDL